MVTESDVEPDSVVEVETEPLSEDVSEMVSDRVALSLMVCEGEGVPVPETVLDRDDALLSDTVLVLE